MAGVRTMASTLTMKKGGSETADTVIASLTSIGEVTGEREEIDVTTLDSPNGAKEYIPGAVDYGSTDIAGNVTDGVQVAKLQSVFNANAVRDWEIETPSGCKESFSAYISAFGFGEKTTDGLDTYTMTLRLTGAVEYSAAGTTGA